MAPVRRAGIGGCAAAFPPSVAASEPATVRADRAVRSPAHVPGAPRRSASWPGSPIVSVRQAVGATSALRVDHMREAVAPVDVFLAPSQTIAERSLTFGIAQRDLVRRGTGNPPFSARSGGSSRHDTPLRVGFAGSLLPSKAPHVLFEAAARLPAGTVTLVILGAGTSYHGDDSYKDTLAPLLAQPFVSQHGTVPTRSDAGHLRRPGRARRAVGLDRERAVRHQGSIRFGVPGRRL